MLINLMVPSQVVIAVPHSNKFGQFEIPKFCLSNDLGNILKMQRLTDVTLLVDGREFLAHKLILIGYIN